ncbi:MAG TPA: hypothetical protein VJN68_14520, partial [Burkholderiaceae bacterium]|nr:hypothetical protein [Burkholderiaceae bacterium]
PVVAPPLAAATVAGVAATGAPIVGRISLKDAAGHEQFVDTTDGRYSFTLTGLTAPFMLKAQWSANGSVQTLYSFSASASGGIANITPLTHAIVVAAAGTEALAALYDAGDASAFGTIAGALPSAVSALQQSFAVLLASQGVAGTDPITTVFAADHTGMDAVLDGVDIGYVAGKLVVTDKASGAVLLEAPSTDPAHAMASAWTAQDAAVAADPDVAVAADGRGLVVWSEIVNGHSAVRARFVSGGASAVTLSSSGDAGLPRLGFDASGNAVVVWTQYENSRNDIWAARYVAASQTWGSPVRISAQAAVSDANVPDVAVDGAGNAIVVWHQGDGRVNHFDVWSARYVASADAWSAPALVSDGINSAYTPRAAVNATGQGVAGWVQQQGDGTTVSNGPQDVWGRTLDASAGTWSARTRLNAVAGNVDAVYGQVAVAMDGQGNGFALWVQGSGSLPFVIHASRLVAASGWQASGVIVNNVLDNCYGPQVAFDAQGNAVAVWQQQTGTGAYGGVNRFGATTGWGTSAAIGTDVPGDVYDAHVAVDGAGNATAVWYQWSDTGITVMSSRAPAGAAWGASILLGSVPSGGFSYPVPRVAANAAGQTLVAWGIDSY